jgi:hypothetical protein
MHCAEGVGSNGASPPKSECAAENGQIGVAAHFYTSGMWFDSRSGYRLA